MATPKSEDQIAKEKDAVQKMIGAKTAMEVAIARIARLEEVIKRMAMLTDDLNRCIGDGLYFKTFHHGGNREEHQLVRDRLDAISAAGRKVL